LISLHFLHYISFTLLPFLHIDFIFSIIFIDWYRYFRHCFSSLWLLRHYFHFDGHFDIFTLRWFSFSMIFSFIYFHAIDISFFLRLFHFLRFHIFFFFFISPFRCFLLPW
jgi:hypothetical protein